MQPAHIFLIYDIHLSLIHSFQPEVVIDVAGRSNIIAVFLLSCVQDVLYIASKGCTVVEVYQVLINVGRVWTFYDFIDICRN